MAKTTTSFSIYHQNLSYVKNCLGQAQPTVVGVNHFTQLKITSSRNLGFIKFLINQYETMIRALKNVIMFSPSFMIDYSTNLLRS